MLADMGWGTGEELDRQRFIPSIPQGGLSCAAIPDQPQGLWGGPSTQLPTPVVWGSPQAPQGLGCTAKVSEVPVSPALSWETMRCRHNHT